MAALKFLRMVSFEEVHEKLQMGLCLVCNKPSTVEHKHNYVILVNEEVEQDSENPNLSNTTTPLLVSDSIPYSSDTISFAPMKDLLEDMNESPNITQQTPTHSSKTKIPKSDSHIATQQAPTSTQNYNPKGISEADLNRFDGSCVGKREDEGGGDAKKWQCEDNIAAHPVSEIKTEMEYQELLDSDVDDPVHVIVQVLACSLDHFPCFEVSGFSSSRVEHPRFLPPPEPPDRIAVPTPLLASSLLIPPSFQFLLPMYYPPNTSPLAFTKHENSFAEPVLRIPWFWVRNSREVDPELVWEMLKRALFNRSLAEMIVAYHRSVVPSLARHTFLSHITSSSCTATIHPSTFSYMSIPTARQLFDQIPNRLIAYGATNCLYNVEGNVNANQLITHREVVSQEIGEMVTGRTFIFYMALDDVSSTTLKFGGEVTATINSRKVVAQEVDHAMVVLIFGDKGKFQGALVNLIYTLQDTWYENFYMNSTLNLPDDWTPEYYDHVFYTWSILAHSEILSFIFQLTNDDWQSNSLNIYIPLVQAISLSTIYDALNLAKMVRELNGVKGKPKVICHEFPRDAGCYEFMLGLCYNDGIVHINPSSLLLKCGAAKYTKLNEYVVVTSNLLDQMQKSQGISDWTLWLISLKQPQNLPIENYSGMIDRCMDTTLDTIMEGMTMSNETIPCLSTCSFDSWIIWYNYLMVPLLVKGKLDHYVISRFLLCYQQENSSMATTEKSPKSFIIKTLNHSVFHQFKFEFSLAMLLLPLSSSLGLVYSTYVAKLSMRCRLLECFIVYSIEVLLGMNITPYVDKAGTLNTRKALVFDIFAFGSGELCLVTTKGPTLLNEKLEQCIVVMIFDAAAQAQIGEIVAYTILLHRKMIHRGDVRSTKVLVKWRELPPKHGTCGCSSLRTRMFERGSIVTE